MTICRINWPYQRSIRLIDKNTLEPVDQAGRTYLMNIYENWGGATLAQFNSTQGYVLAASGGRIVFNIPKYMMQPPLRPGRFPMEVMRTDQGQDQPLLRFIMTVGREDDLLTDPVPITTDQELVVIQDDELLIEVEVGIPGVTQIVNSTGTTQWANVEW